MRRLDHQWLDLDRIQALEPLAAEQDMARYP